MAFADFGPMIVETDVDDAVINTLRYWFPSYLKQTIRERNLPLAPPSDESYATVLDDDEFPEQRMPAVLVTTSDTIGSPDVDAAGAYYVTFETVVSTVARGRTPAEARRNAALFSGTARRILAQQSTLLGFAGGSRWTAGQLRPVQDTTGQNRYLVAGTNTFAVYVDGVVDLSAGPTEPSDVYEAPPTVQAVFTDIS
jgi:hypothetical protein